jgi:hypothetical protein
MTTTMDPGAALGFRAVIQVGVGVRDFVYHGPYDSYGTAKAQVTRLRRRLGNVFIDGWVEKTELNWEKW